MLEANYVRPFTGRGRAEDRSNYSNRSAAAVRCSGWLFAAALASVENASQAIGHQLLFAWL